MSKTAEKGFRVGDSKPVTLRHIFYGNTQTQAVR